MNKQTSPQDPDIQDVYTGLLNEIHDASDSSIVTLQKMWQQVLKKYNVTLFPVRNRL